MSRYWASLTLGQQIFAEKASFGSVIKRIEGRPRDGQPAASTFDMFGYTELWAIWDTTLPNAAKEALATQDGNEAQWQLEGIWPEFYEDFHHEYPYSLDYLDFWVKGPDYFDGEFIMERIRKDRSPGAVPHLTQGPWDEYIIQSGYDILNTRLVIVNHIYFILIKDGVGTIYYDLMTQTAQYRYEDSSALIISSALTSNTGVIPGNITTL